MITVIWLAELLRHSIVVRLRQEPFYGGTLFRLKQQRRKTLYLQVSARIFAHFIFARRIHSVKDWEFGAEIATNIGTSLDITYIHTCTGTKCLLKKYYVVRELYALDERKTSGESVIDRVDVSSHPILTSARTRAFHLAMR